MSKDHSPTSSRYRIAVDLETCDGVFACLVRDGRFQEAEDGLVTLPGGERRGGDRDERRDGDRTGAAVVATFDDDRRDEAERAAAAACPLDAIDVTEGEP